MAPEGRTLIYLKRHDVKEIQNNYIQSNLLFEQ